MSLALTIRLTVAMTLMRDTSYTGAMRRLAQAPGRCALDRDWHVPTSGVATEWRGKVPPTRRRSYSGWQPGHWLTGDSDDGDDGPVLVLGGMPVCGIDGMLVALANTPANRAMFGCTGTRHQKRAGFGAVPAVAGGGDHRGRAGPSWGRSPGGRGPEEQTLLARLIRRRPDLFAGRVVGCRSVCSGGQICRLCVLSEAPRHRPHLASATRWMLPGSAA